MKFKNYFFLILLSLFLNQCNAIEDIEEALAEEIIEEEEILLEVTPVSDLKVIALQTIEFKIANLEGDKSGYKLYFDEMLVQISDLDQDVIRVNVPLESSIGIKDIKLIFGSKEYDLGQIEILDPLEIFPAGVNYIETENEEMPFIFIDSLNNFSIPYFKDGKVEMMTIEKTDGTTTKILFNENKLPKYIYDEKITILIDNYDYENYTADLAFFPNDDIENVEYILGFQLDEAIFLQENSNKTSVNKSFPGIPIMYSKAFNPRVTMSATCFGAAVNPFLPDIYDIADCKGWKKTQQDYIFIYDIDEDYRNARSTQKLLEQGCLSSNDINNSLAMNLARQSCAEQRLQNAKLNREVMNDYISTRKDYFEQILTTLNSVPENNLILGVWETTLLSSTNCSDPDYDEVSSIDCENDGNCLFVEFLPDGTISETVIFDGITEVIEGGIYEIIDEETLRICYSDEGELSCSDWAFEINNDQLIITGFEEEFGCTERYEFIKR